MHNNMKVIINENTYIGGVLLLFLIPFRWLLAWLIAILLHEFFHYLTVIILGGNISQISIDIRGIRMDANQLSDKKRIVAILSGPVCGYLPVFLGGYFPELAICCCVLSIYNLLPLTGLDGGNILCVFIKNQRIINWIEGVILTVLFLSGIFCTFFLQLGMIPMIIGTVLFFRGKKSLAKNAYARYNKCTFDK